MLANLFHLRGGRPPPPEQAHRAFVEELRVYDRERRDPRVERVILWCWLLIAAKHVAVIVAVHRFAMPFHQLWVNFPTWLLGALATGIYCWRVRRR